MLALCLSAWAWAEPAQEAFFARDTASLRALTEGADASQAWFYLGLMARELGDLEEAEACFRAATASGGAPPWFELGVTLAWMGRVDDAEEAVAQALSVDPSLPGAALMHARLLGWQGRHQQALTAMNALVQAAPDDPEIRAARGSVHLARGAPAAARADFEHALLLNPVHSEATTGLQTVNALRRGSARAGVDLWISGAQPGLGASASLNHRPRSRLGLGADWRMGVSPQLGAQDSTRPVHQGGAALRLQSGPWQLGSGVQARGGGSPWLGLPLTVGRETALGALEAGWTPGRSKEGWDHRASVAWSHPLPHESWTRVQVQAAQVAGGQSVGVAWSGGTAVGETALRADLASLRDPEGWLHVAAVAWTLPLGADHGLSVSAQGITGRFQLVQAGVAWELALR